MDKPNHSDYDPCTLYVPESYIKSCTPGMGNWWKIKSKNYDSIIFYKVGKFYELYHMDAGVGVTHCGLTFMRGKFAHAGFPEVRFEHFTSMLLNKEDWVGKKKSLSKFEKQTRREVCRIETPGTRMADFTPETLESAEKLFAAIFEENGTIGVCLVDVSRSILSLGEFTDDIYYTNLRTLFAHRNIGEIIFCSKSPDAIKQIVKVSIPNTTQNMVPEKKFPPIAKTTKLFASLNLKNTI